MAVISFTVDDAKMPDVIDAMCDAHHWRDAAQDGPRAAFARQALILHVKNVYANWMRRKAADAAAAAVNVTVDVT